MTDRAERKRESGSVERVMAWTTMTIPRMIVF